MIDIALCNDIFMSMVTMRMLRAATVCVPSMFPGDEISVPSITISELVVKKPSCNPVWFVRSGKVPVVACMAVSGSGNTCHGFVLGLLDKIAPVVGWFPLAVALQVTLIGR
jgi:hypothetical protein